MDFNGKNVDHKKVNFDNQPELGQIKWNSQSENVMHFKSIGHLILIIWHIFETFDMCDFNKTFWYSRVKILSSCLIISGLKNC